MKGLLCSMLLACLIPAVTWATPITVRFDPSAIEVDPGDTFQVDLLADINSSTPILGWGLDVGYNTSILDLTGVTIGSSWTPLPAPDGDQLAGATFPFPISGNGTLLATLTFGALMGGDTALMASVTSGDLTEGFFGVSAGTVSASFLDAPVHVTPEPGTMLLLGSGLFGMVGHRWRRRQQDA